jgi:hypothetical protein
MGMVYHYGMEKHIIGNIRREKRGHELLNC